MFLNSSTILTALLLLPILGGLGVLALPPGHAKKARPVAMIFCLATLLLSILAASWFDWTRTSYGGPAAADSVQLAFRVTWIRSLGAQYAALAGYVVVEAVIFVPLLYAANRFAPGVISSAALVSFAGFSALTAIAFYTRKDFSFLRGILLWAGFGALALIVAGALFGFQLGTFFSVAMVVFAGAAILYDTSNIIHRFPEDRHVAAALSLFASVALLFWYVLRLFLSSRD